MNVPTDKSQPGVQGSAIPKVLSEPEPNNRPSNEAPLTKVVDAGRISGAASRKIEVTPEARRQIEETGLGKKEEAATAQFLSSEKSAEQVSSAVAPVPLSKALDGMKLSILMYSDDPAERLVFINGVKYREGDYVEGLYLLERITPEGAVLSHQGEHKLLGLGSR